MAKNATIIQFNDAYHLSQGRDEPVGGPSRFSGFIKQHEEKNPLVLCSGDVFSPSLMTIVFRGKHMAEVCTLLNTRVAVVGNHDFDLGLEQLINLAESMEKTTWILSNVFDVRDHTILGGFPASTIVEWNGIKFGFIGLVEPEWIATLSMDTSNIICEDPAEVGSKLAAELRQEGAEVIIALTHMRMHNDIELAKKITNVDLILGGHDHECYHEFINGIHVAKSGTEWRYASVVDVSVEPGQKPKIDYKLVPITSDIPEDPVMAECVSRYSHNMEEKMKKPLGYVVRDLDARASFVRTQESEIGNLLTDVMRNEVQADFALLNSGTIRTDAIIAKGTFTMKDLFNLLPFEDLTCKTEITGKILIQALENGVSQYPKHEGRFPQVSGFTFTFDPSKPPGSRVVEVLVGGKPIDEEKKYTLACKPYISIDGKDGYDCFIGTPSLISLEECFVNSVSLSNYLRSLSVIQAWKFKLAHPEEEEKEDGTPLKRKPVLAKSASYLMRSHIKEEEQTLQDALHMVQHVDGAPHHLGQHWAKASIGPPAAPKTHHFKDLVGNIVEKLHMSSEHKLALIEPVIEGRIKMVKSD